MIFLRAALHQWRITPLRGHALSILEGGLISTALQLYASGWRTTGGLLGFAGLILAYADGRFGWSVKP
jgi:hypothetical protein